METIIRETKPANTQALIELLKDSSPAELAASLDNVLQLLAEMPALTAETEKPINPTYCFELYHTVREVRNMFWKVGGIADLK